VIGGIAMGGVFKQPHLLKDAPERRRRALQHFRIHGGKSDDAMYGVVNEAHGTAGALKLDRSRFSGKSGTRKSLTTICGLASERANSSRTIPGL